MKFLVFVLILFFSFDLSGQVRIEKMGLMVGVHRVTASYNYLKHNKSIKKERTLLRQRIGAKITLPLGRRFSFETGLLLDNIIFKKDEGSDSFIIFNNVNFLSLIQHNMIKLGAPMTLLFRTYQTEACVTFLKLTWNNQVMVYEKERYREGTQDAFGVTSSFESILSNSQSGFDFSNSDLELSFGTYFSIESFNAQIAIEPKFSFYNYTTNNGVNTLPEINLYDNHSRILGAIGLEVTMYKFLN